MEAYWTEGVARRLKVDERLRLTCAALGRFDLLKDVLVFERAGTVPEVVQRDGRRYLAYPHFGDGTEGLPDAVYEVRVAEQIGGECVAPLPSRAVPGSQDGASFARARGAAGTAPTGTRGLTGPRPLGPPVVHVGLARMASVPVFSAVSGPAPVSSETAGSAEGGAARTHVGCEGRPSAGGCCGGCAGTYGWLPARARTAV